jgi:hypothetical protein
LRLLLCAANVEGQHKDYRKNSELRATIHVQVCHPACQLTFFATQVAEPAMAVSCEYDKHLSRKKQEWQLFSH